MGRVRCATGSEHTSTRHAARRSTHRDFYCHGHTATRSMPRTPGSTQNTGDIGDSPFVANIVGQHLATTRTPDAERAQGSQVQLKQIDASHAARIVATERALRVPLRQRTASGMADQRSKRSVCRMSNDKRRGRGHSDHHGCLANAQIRPRSCRVRRTSSRRGSRRVF